jgi:hypothetical protein
MRATGGLGVYLLVFGGLFGCGSAWGQTNGEIRGTVNDPSGAVVPSVTVTATLTGTDTTRSVTSDKDGAFDIPELAVGNYDVTADAQGFKKFVAKNVVVTIGHVNFITVTLQLGAGNRDPRIAHEYAQRLRIAAIAARRSVATGQRSFLGQ